LHRPLSGHGSLALLLAAACTPGAEPDRLPDVPDRFATIGEALAHATRSGHPFDDRIAMRLPGGHVLFERDGGLQFTPGDGVWHGELLLAEAGRDGALSAPAEPQITLDGTLVSLERDTLVEWYHHGPAGLEQGFSVRERPEGNGELVLAYEVHGLTPRPSDGVVLLIDEADQPAVEISGLFADDADGEPLPVRMVAYPEEQRLELRVDDDGARYPLRIDPLLTVVESTATALDATAGFGSALSIDGSRVAVGAPGLADDDGIVAILERNEQGQGGWGIEQTLYAPAGLVDFGASVALDYPTLIVGAPGSATTYTEAVLYEHLEGSGWSEQHRVVAGTIASGFGAAVAMAPQAILVGEPGANSVQLFVPTDSGPAVLGAQLAGVGLGSALAISWPLAVVGAPDSNRVEVHTISSSSVEAASLTGTGSFGHAVDIDGLRLVIGAPGAGEVHVVELDAATYATSSRPLPTDGLDALDGFGTDVAVDGDTIAVTDTVGGGRAHVYQLDRAADEWRRTDTIELTGADGASTPTVQLTSDTLVVGSPTQGTGTVRTFTRTAEQLLEVYAYTDSTSFDDAAIGRSVALDGDLAVVGAPLYSTPYSPLPTADGAAFTFLRDGESWQHLITQRHIDAAGAGNQFGAAVALDNGILVVGEPLAGASGTGRAHTYAFDGDSWDYIDELTLANATANAAFGSAVDVDGGIIAVGAPGHNTGDGAITVATVNIGTMAIGLQADLEPVTSGAGAGASIAVDGARVAFGAPKAFSNGGEVYVTDFGLDTSGELAFGDLEVLSGGAASARCGTSIALESDLLVMGCRNQIGPGGARIYHRSVAGWVYDLEVTSGEVVIDGFGAEVAAQGGRLFVGAPDVDTVYAFERNEGGADQWGELPALARSGAVGDDFGRGLDLYGDQLLVGAPQIGVSDGYATFYVLDTPLPPVAVDDSFAGQEDTASVLLVADNDFDGNGDAFDIELQSQPSNGTAVVSGLQVTYTPAADFNGPDAFTYRLRSTADGLLSQVATVDVDVAPVNDPPVIGNPAPVYEALEDQVLTIDAANGLLVGVTDIDGPPAQVTPVGLRSTDQGGTVELFSDGAFDYTPAPDFAGTDTFAITISDSLDVGLPDPVIVTLNVTDVPEAPVLVDQLYRVTAKEVLRVDAPGLATDAFIPQGARTWSVDATGAQGTLTVQPSGAFVYEAPPSGVQTDFSVFLTVAGTDDPSNTIAVTFVVDDAPGAPPSAYDDRYVVAVGDTLDLEFGDPNAIVGVLRNDHSGVGNPLVGAQAAGALPPGLALASNGALLYPATAAGTVQFDYEAIALDETTDVATVTIDVLPTSEADFSAMPDSYEVDVAAGTLVVGAAEGVLVNDASDAPLQAVLAAPPDRGAVALAADGSFVYTPPRGFSGSTSFAYRATDGSAMSLPVDVTLVAVGEIVETADTAPPTVPTDTGDCTSAYFVDSDADGYGNDRIDPVLACQLEAGLAEVGGDCDDTRSDVHPGAAEIAGDGDDQDCDGADADIAPAGACQGAPAPSGVVGLLVWMAALRRRRSVVGGEA